MLWLAKTIAPMTVAPISLARGCSRRADRAWLDRRPRHEARRRAHDAVDLAAHASGLGDKLQGPRGAAGCGGADPPGGPRGGPQGGNGAAGGRFPTLLTRSSIPGTSRNRSIGAARRRGGGRRPVLLAQRPALDRGRQAAGDPKGADRDGRLTRGEGRTASQDHAKLSLSFPRTCRIGA